MPRKKVNIAITKLQQLADKVLSDLGYDCTAIEFSQEFKKQFSQEYAKYESGYKRVLQQQNEGKGTPPSPEAYLKIAYNNAVKRHNKEKANVESV